MTFAIHRLGDGARPTVTAHFLALPMKDRRLRFGTSLAPRVIAAYVDGIDFDRDAVFGVHDDQLVLVGVAHVAFEDGQAELGRRSWRRAVQTRPGARAQPLHTAPVHALRHGKCADHADRAEVRYGHCRRRRR